MNVKASASNGSLLKKVVQLSLVNAQTGKALRDNIVFLVPKDATEVFSASEAAKYLKITMRTLKNYRYEGELEYLQYNSRKIVYTKNQLDSFLRSKVKRFDTY
jgi:hypothetical protein